jgi:hypothetical protein
VAASLRRPKKRGPFPSDACDLPWATQTGWRRACQPRGSASPTTSTRHRPVHATSRTPAAHPASTSGPRSWPRLAQQDTPRLAIHRLFGPSACSRQASRRRSRSAERNFGQGNVSQNSPDPQVPATVPQLAGWASALAASIFGVMRRCPVRVAADAIASSARTVSPAFFTAPATRSAHRMPLLPVAAMILQCSHPQGRRRRLTTASVLVGPVAAGTASAGEAGTGPVFARHGLLRRRLYGRWFCHLGFPSRDESVCTRDELRSAGHGSRLLAAGQKSSRLWKVVNAGRGEVRPKKSIDHTVGWLR